MEDSGIDQMILVFVEKNSIINVHRCFQNDEHDDK